jgi:dipeptidyl aminopeptidase/acylaminoacyl peptidase
MSINARSRILPAALLAVAAGLGAHRPAAGAELTPFAAQDLVRFERVSDPQLAPDGSQVAYQLRETDFEANKGVTGIWLRPLRGADPTARRLTAPGVGSTTPRWSPDGRALYFLSTRTGSSQVWRLALPGGEAQQVTHAPLDIGSFMLAPGGAQLLVSMEMYADCQTLACTRARLDARAAQKRSGELYDKLFMRHWDSWSNGTRSQLFIYALDAQGVARDAEPSWITRGIDGDVPSKPFGDDGEYCFTPDGRSVIFSARSAGRTEAWSTNFDLYTVPVDGSRPAQNLTAANPAWDTGPAVSPDGRTLAYRAMRRAGFESDRFGIMLRDLASGETHELLPRWDRSAETLRWSADGRRLYTMADDLGQRRLFVIDVAQRSVRALSDKGTVHEFTLAAEQLVYARDALDSPTQLYLLDPVSAASAAVLTAHNAGRLATAEFGAYEQFQFKGWNNDTVYGYVLKPAGYVAGRRYPVAFIIHGSPQSSMGNTFHYRWNPQVYAGAGFAVVFIDFHGSTGYGQAFTDSVSRHWGDRPLEDLQKGWAYALAHYDFLDGSNACALGASYGGYMVNWIAGNWSRPASGAWKCLVSHDGDFDLRAGYYETEELWFDEWERGGPQFLHPEDFERFNPLNHVKDWHLPMLVVHGALDFRVPLTQGIATFTALQRRGIPSQFLYFPDENHWVLKPQNSLQWHETVLAWLKRWTAP